jgi:hypothetical protein
VTDLTPEERSTLARFLTERTGRLDIFFTYAIYFVPSLLFGCYGMWRGDFAAVAIGYVVMVGLVFYLIARQGRSNPIFRSAIRKLLNEDIAEKVPAPSPPPAA